MFGNKYYGLHAENYSDATWTSNQKHSTIVLQLLIEDNEK